MPVEPASDHQIGVEKPVGRGDRCIAVLAARQHGVVSRPQLLVGGVTRRSIERRLETGRLHLLHRGVYAVGHRALTREGRWLAAVLEGGWAAALSHRSAAELWGLLSTGSGPVDVTIRNRRRSVGRAGIRWHESSLPGDEVTQLRGIPVTTVARTLVDLAAVVSSSLLEKAVNEAEVRRLGDAVSVVALLARHRGRRGVRALRAIVDAGNVGDSRTRSGLERRFLAFLRRYELPRPQTNVPIAIRDGFVEADCLWREQRLIVELDSRTVHATAASFESDRARDRKLLLEGWDVVRITSRQLRYDAARLAADLRALLFPHRTGP